MTKTIMMIVVGVTMTVMIMLLAWCYILCGTSMQWNNLGPA